MSDEESSNFKGFGPPPKPSTTPAKKKSDYGKKELEDYIAKKGGEAYSVYVRTGEKGRWFPAGTIAAPADKVDEAIMGSRLTLNTNALKTFPKLRGQEATFEYGYQPLDKLRDPIVLAVLVKRSWLDRVKSFFKR